MPAKKQEILNQKINNLPFTEEFKLFAQKLNVITIKELVSFPITAIIKSEGFSYHVLQELVNYLEGHEISSALID